MIGFLKKYSKLLSTASILSAAVFGAGMFSLPYIFSQAGFLVGLVYLAAFATLLSTTHYLYSEVVRATPNKHRFLGYVNIYLGRKGWVTAIFTTALGILISLTVLIILAPSFVSLVFPNFPPLYASLIFWILASLPMLLKIERIAILESLSVVIIILIAFAIFIIGLLHPAQSLGSIKLFSWPYLFLPYGAVVFSLAGRSAISSLMDYAADEQVDAPTVKKAIIIGTVTPAITYAFFIIGVLLLSKSVTTDAVTGLAYLPRQFTVLLGALGVFALWAGYVCVSREIEGIFRYDFRTSKDTAMVFVAAIPIIFFSLGLRDFIALVGIIGGVFLALEHTMVTLMWRKITNRRPIWSYVVICLLVVGALYEVIKLF